MISGVLLLMVALGVNTIYSLQSVCLDTFPPQCHSGYDGLTGATRTLISPGLYVIGALVFAAGIALWSRKIRLAAPGT